VGLFCVLLVLGTSTCNTKLKNNINLGLLILSQIMHIFPNLCTILQKYRIIIIIQDTCEMFQHYIVSIEKLPKLYVQHNIMIYFTASFYVLTRLNVNHQYLLIDWLVLNTSFSSISAIAWRPSIFKIFTFLYIIVSPIFKWKEGCFGLQERE